MPKMEVGRAVGPSFDHMVRVLFRPFVLRKWLALGFVYLVAYGGSGTFFNIPSFPGRSGRPDT